jgi:hypothetical protein
MAEFPGHSVRRMQQMSIDEDPYAYTFRDRYRKKISGCDLRKPHLSQHARVGGVLHLHGKPGRLFERFLQVELGPFEVGSEDYFAPLLVEAARYDHADAFKEQLRVIGHHSQEAFREHLLRDFRGSWGLDCLPFQETAGHICHRYRACGRSQVQRK